MPPISTRPLGGGFALPLQNNLLGPTPVGAPAMSPPPGGDILLTAFNTTSPANNTPFGNSFGTAHLFAAPTGTNNLTAMCVQLLVEAIKMMCPTIFGGGNPPQAPGSPAAVNTTVSAPSSPVPGVTLDAARPNAMAVSPALAAEIARDYSANNDASGNLNVAGINAASQNKGLATFVLGYAAEIKEYSRQLQQLQQTGSYNRNDVFNRLNNPAGLARSMTFDGSFADSALLARMTFKNGTYNQGVFGDYNLPQIVQVYEQRVGQLPPALRQEALNSEVAGMGLLHFMESRGFVTAAESFDANTGASPLGFWRATGANGQNNNTAYLAAVNALRNGTLRNDLLLSLQGNDARTVGRLDAFHEANRLGRNGPVFAANARGVGR